MRIYVSLQTSLVLLLISFASAAHAISGECAQFYAKPPQLSINQLMTKALAEPAGTNAAKLQLQTTLKLNDLNFAYYFSLFSKHKAPVKSEVTKLFPANSKLVGFPVQGAKVPKEINESVRSVNYSEIAKTFDGRYAKNTMLIVKKLQAGTGSSILREAYFAKRPELAGQSIGAKGTDLLVEIPHPLDKGKTVEISIVELQLLQLLDVAKHQDLAGIMVQDIVGPETQHRLKEVWQKKSLLDPSLTYAELFQKTLGISRLSSLFQSHVPSLNERGEVTFNRKAPAGHGLFAVDALRALFHPSELPRTKGKALVSAIANGEDVNSLPDSIMIDWIVKNKIPITLVTTTKASIDKKGGILLLVKDSQTGEQYLKVMDTAEAKAIGQLKEFEASEGIVSTNLTLFNYDILQKKLAHLSEEALLKIMAPDLIPNWKEQKDADGVVRKYLQLEGTMGSVIMNLDRYYRKTFGEPLVHILNIENKQRLDFFSPIKSAFDYFMQFHSDLFHLSTQNYKLKFQGLGELPGFKLTDPATKDKYYQEVQNVLDSFAGTSIRQLTDLNVEGQVMFSGAILEGRVVVKNTSGKPFDLANIKDRLPLKAGRLLLRYTEIIWDGTNIIINQLPLEKGLGVAYARVATSGSHTDYNSGLTLAALLPVKTETRVKRRDDDTVNVLSGDKAASYILGQEKISDDWSDYIRGITVVLKEAGFNLSGFDATITTTIPFGSGISSSSALVISVLKAVRSEFELPIDDLTIAQLGQKVEHYVGAKVGLLDQMTISLLDQDVNSALMIDFKSMTSKKVKMPEDAEFVILHTGLTHSLKDSHGTRNYATRRAECEAAAKILGVQNLSQLSVAQLESRKSELSPVLYKRAHHVVSENERVVKFVTSAKAADLSAMGKIMNESHKSQNEDYDISETPINAIVSILQNTNGVFGAQLTGGGFGGAVVFLAKKGQGRQLAEKIIPAYAAHPANGGQYKAFVIAP